MFSARKLLIVAASMTLIAGCAERNDGSRAQQLSPAPIHQDEAMGLRQWQTDRALYANGSSVSYPTLYPYEPRSNAPDVENMVMAPALFVGQTLLLPVTAITTPAWEKQVYRGVYTPPTYTAVPVVQRDAVGYSPIARWPLPEPRPGREADRPGARQ